MDTLFASRLRADGTCYLQPHASSQASSGSDIEDYVNATGLTSDSDAGVHQSCGVAIAPEDAMVQPELRFVGDWPMFDARWRQLTERMLWPSVQRTLALLADGAFCIRERS